MRHGHEFETYTISIIYHYCTSFNPTHCFNSSSITHQCIDDGLSSLLFPPTTLPPATAASRTLADVVDFGIVKFFAEGLFWGFIKLATSASAFARSSFCRSLRYCSESGYWSLEGSDEDDAEECTLKLVDTPPPPLRAADVSPAFTWAGWLDLLAMTFGTSGLPKKNSIRLF